MNNILNQFMSDFYIMLNGELFEIHSSVESAKKTVEAMKKSGDYDSTDKIVIVGIN